MSFWHAFLPRRSAEPDRFLALLAQRAIYVTQKTVIDYCRVKAGRQERALFADPVFTAALTHARWRVYFGAVADHAALAEAWLRPASAGREAALAEVLAARMAAGMLAEPAPEDERAAQAEAAAGLLPHLARAQLGPPHPAHELPMAAEAPLLALVPIHPDLRRGEEPSLRGALRFHLVGTQELVERRFDRDALAAALLSGG